MRRHLVIALLVAAGLGTPSDAAPRCPFVVDPPGDTGEAGGLPDHALDLRSVDIASDARTLTMVARVTSLALPPSTSPTGVLYQMQFRVDEVNFLASARYSPVEGSSFHLQRVNGHVGGTGAYTPTALPSKITGRFDTRAGSITVDVPVADLNRVVRVTRGDHIDQIGAISWRTAGLKDVESFVASSDFAEGRGAYRAGSPSCIKPRR